MGTATESTGVMEQASKPPLAELTAESFRPCVGTIFVFHGVAADGSVSSSGADLELIEVNAQPGGLQNRDPRWRQPFSLLFILRAGSLSTSGLCRMAHEGFEPFDIFLSRVDVHGRPAAQQHYEAVFG